MHDNNENRTGTIIVGLLLVITFFAWLNSSGKVSDLESANIELETKVKYYEDELRAYDTRVEEANRTIEDAKNCEGGCEYEEMQSAISDLKAIETYYSQ